MTAFLVEEREDEELRQQGASIRRAVGLGGRLIEQLVLFGDEASADSGRVDLAGILDRLRPLLGDLTTGKRLDIAVLAEAPIIVANAAQIEQVLLNLCVNAAEAIPSGTDGVIRIEIRDPRPGEEVDPTSVVLSVEDNGRGMDAETLSHLFEPYFSRKANGHGIGLSVVYGIVKRCRGTISVRSEPGAGATFTIAVPRAPAPEPLR